MGANNNYLITLVNGKTLLKVAVRFKELSEKEKDNLKYWAELECQEWIKDQLPNHIESVGDVVKVEELFDII
jgi:hypothetical protein